MSTTAPSTTANAEISMVSRAATVQNLYYAASAVNGASKTNTITVYHNGSSTALTCSVTNATTCSDTSDTFTVTRLWKPEIQFDGIFEGLGVQPLPG